ncbi:MAG: phosphoribosylaminoimidazolesuccinocarboxamide synthase [Flavobacteriales bacterium]|nr:phosphoribosylaminoimidazolesuccinocarboxamide synthase [Flavobacteriales bacterium]
MAEALKETNYHFPGQKKMYRGKVRDVYHIGEKHLAMVASDRISAFDHVLPKGIPFKGQVLNQLAARFLDATRDIVPNWMVAVPDPNVTVGLKCDPIKVEMVIRGYLSGHAWREYRTGKRLICGVDMPEGMRESDRFPSPIITPATKADEGHDEDISREDILGKGIIEESIYLKLEEYTRALFQRGTEIAAAQGLILVDTKYEFGIAPDDTITLIDEIHTPDSSRYFYAEGYEERQERGEDQKQLSKEFVRQWLISNGFQGLEGQSMPVMPDDFVKVVSDRYIELFEKITGDRFIKADTDRIQTRVESNIASWIQDNLT